ncbi:MAG TPA: hypothetical protein PKC12_01135 [Thiobacillaceae bacterium]|nr:hypothetical protein [Thiobacillaceae bacterium]
MKRRSFLGSLVGATTLAAVAASGYARAQSGGRAAAPTAAAAPELHSAMRGLWRGHIVTTRDYARKIHAGDRAAADKAATAVVDNAKQIADAVAGFYGKEAGPATLNLLSGHWAGVKALTLAAKENAAADKQKAMDALAANATEIAKFFAGANPQNWTVEALQSALIAHAGHHEKQVTAMMANAPAAEQERLWAEMQRHMDMIADTLSGGIAKQFPDKAK